MNYFTTIITASLITFSSPAFSQLNIMKYNGACGDKKEFAEVITNYSELPFAGGISNRSLDGLPDRKMVIFVNPETLTWTIAEKVTEDVYCVIALGTGFTPIPSEAIENKEEKSI